MSGSTSRVREQFGPESLSEGGFVAARAAAREARAAGPANLRLGFSRPGGAAGRPIRTACGARVSLRLVSFQHANEDVERMLLGNKCDMEDKRVVPRAKGEQVSGGQKLAYQSKLTFFRHPLSYLSPGSLV